MPGSTCQVRTSSLRRQEAAAAANDLARLGDLPASAPAQVAIVYDYKAHWITAIQPQGADFRYSALVFRWYEAIRRLGLDVDLAGIAAATGIVAFGPRAWM